MQSQCIAAGLDVVEGFFSMGSACNAVHIAQGTRSVPPWLKRTGRCRRRPRGSGNDARRRNSARVIGQALEERALYRQSI